MDAVLVDAGGVLTMPDVDLVREALSTAGVPLDAETLDRAHDIGIQAYDRAGGGDAGRRAFLAAYVRAAGVPERRAEPAARHLRAAIRAAANAWSRARPGAQRGLRAICATGVSVVVVSNSDGTVERSLRDLCLCQVGPGPSAQVAAVLDSAVVGISKPDPRIFALALSKAGVPATRAMHVGDSVQADVEGARAAGVTPVHFDPHRLCRTRDHEHVVSLDEVAGRLRSLGRIA